MKPQYLLMVMIVGLVLCGPEKQIRCATEDSLSVHEGFPAYGFTGNGGNYPVVADLDNDGTNEIIMVAGNGEGIFVYTDDGKNKTGWPQLNYGSSFSAGFAVGDVDKDGMKEIVTFHIHKTLQEEPEPVFVPVSSQITVWKCTGQIYVQKSFVLPGFENISHVGLVDVDNDGDLEIFAGVNRSLVGLHHTGSFVAGWPRSTQNSMFCHMSPALADIDNDGEVEVLMNSVSGELQDRTTLYCYSAGGILEWQREMAHVTEYSPVVTDTDGDGMMEVYMIAGGCEGSDMSFPWLYGFDHRGEDRWPPVAIPARDQLSPAIESGEIAVGDVDGDGDVEFAFTLKGIPDVFVMHHTGDMLAGFPQRVGASHNGGISLFDIDADGDQEIFYGVFEQQYNGQEYYPKALYGWHYDGALVSGFPLHHWFLKYTYDVIPTFGDIDNDGLSECVWPYGNMLIFDTPFLYSPLLNAWVTFRGNALRSGVSLIEPNRPPVARAALLPSKGNAPLTVQYDATQSYDPDQQKISYMWSFGDGAYGNDVVGSHTYVLRAGEGVSVYAADVTVSDPFKETDVKSFVVTVEDKTNPYVMITSPVESAVVSPKGFTISGIAFDNESRISYVEVSMYDIKKSSYVVRNSIASYDAVQKTWSFVVRKEKIRGNTTYSITARAYDLNNNVCVVTRTVSTKQFKEELLSLSVVTPREGSNVSEKGFLIIGKIESSNVSNAPREVTVTIRDKDVQNSIVSKQRKLVRNKIFLYAVSRHVLIPGHSLVIDAHMEDENGEITKANSVTVSVVKTRLK